MVVAMRHLGSSPTPADSGLVRKHSGATNGIQHCLCDLADVLLLLEFRRIEALDDLPLAWRRDRAIAQERRQHFVMPQILAPGLEFLRRPADSLSEPHQRIPEAVRVEVGQAGAGERLAEDGADPGGAAPVC